jgi:hypothetical protein
MACWTLQYGVVQDGSVLAVDKVSIEHFRNIQGLVKAIRNTRAGEEGGISVWK